MTKIKLLLPFLLLPLTASAQLTSGTETRNIYFIGNSLTASLTLDRVHTLFDQAGIDLQFGSQLSGGKSLIRHMNYKDEPGQKWINWETIVPAGNSFDPDGNPYNKQPGERFGYYEEALSGHAWDAVVMQTYGGSLHDDVKAIRHFTDICLENNTCDTFFYYSSWPRRPKKRLDSGEVAVLDVDYPAVWTKPYAFALENDGKQARRFTPTRDFTDKVFEAVRDGLPGDTTLRMIPVGEVLFALDAKIKAGKLPGLLELAERDPERVPGAADGANLSRGINLLYADGVHLNPIPHKGGTVGIFVSGTTVFTVLSGKNPVGMSAAAYGLDDEKDAALIRALQQTIWEVVTADARTGVQ